MSARDVLCVALCYRQLSLCQTFIRFFGGRRCQHASNSVYVVERYANAISSETVVLYLGASGSSNEQGVYYHFCEVQAVV